LGSLFQVLVYQLRLDPDFKTQFKFFFLVKIFENAWISSVGDSADAISTLSQETICVTFNSVEFFLNFTDSVIANSACSAEFFSKVLYLT
jgi:hypothetical protein